MDYFGSNIQTSQENFGNFFLSIRNAFKLEIEGKQVVPLK